MQREQADHLYLWDMLTAARAVVDFTKDRTFDEYSNDLTRRSAFERQVEIIREAFAESRKASGLNTLKSQGLKSWASATFSPTTTGKPNVIVSGKWPPCMCRR